MKRLTPLLYWLTLSSFAFAQDAELDIPFEEFYLDNGLRVIVHEDHKAPIVAVTLWYHVGSRNENVGKTGFRDNFFHLITEVRHHQFSAGAAHFLMRGHQGPESKGGNPVNILKIHRNL